MIECNENIRAHSKKECTSIGASLSKSSPKFEITETFAVDIAKFTLKII